MDAAELRVSGTPEMRLRMSIDNKPDANLTAYLVDYGPISFSDRARSSRPLIRRSSSGA